MATFCIAHMHCPHVLPTCAAHMCCPHVLPTHVLPTHALPTQDSFITPLVMRLRLGVFMTGETIFRIGDVGHEM